MSLFGRYIPVANEPWTSNRDCGHIESTAARTRSTAAFRPSASSAVGSKKRQKSTISACRRTSGDLSFRSLSAVPGGLHGGSGAAFASSSHAFSSASSSAAAAAASSVSRRVAAARFASGTSSSDPKSMKSSPRPSLVTGSGARATAVPPMRVSFLRWREDGVVRVLLGLGLIRPRPRETRRDRRESPRAHLESFGASG